MPVGGLEVEQAEREINLVLVVAQLTKRQLARPVSLP
jgi:hypothetical protein